MRFTYARPDMKQFLAMQSEYAHAFSDVAEYALQASAGGEACG